MRPTPRAALIFAVAIAIAAGAAFAGAAGAAGWLALTAAYAALVGIDAWRLPRRATLEAGLAAPREIVVGQEAAVDLVLTAAAPRGTKAEVRLESEGLDPLATMERVLVGTSSRFSFALRGDRRGVARVERAWVRFTGPWALACRIVALPLPTEIRVAPRALAPGREVRRFEAKDAPAGTKIERYDGDGSEFDTLREFRAGDDSRALDWKATARHRSLLRRQFRAERDHDIVVALDTGRLMAERIAGTPKLDPALRSALGLVAVAISSGDRAGLFAFDERPHVSLRPAGGVRAHDAIRRAVLPLEAREVETNYTLGLSTLLQVLRRRTLVVVISDFSDTVSAELLIENLARMRRRHVVVFVTMTDPVLDALEAEAPADRTALHRAVLAGTLKRERRLVLERVRRLGISVVVAPAERLTGELIDRYLDLKRREVA